MFSRSSGPILKTLLFTALVPCTVTLLVPYLLEHGHTHVTRPFLSWPGIALCVFGAAIYLVCAWDFAIVGGGTPAPLAPTTALVVTGLYRFVRNPMYVGVEAVVWGEALMLYSIRLLSYAIALAAGFELFVVFYEEPALGKRFGTSYRVYCKSVRRWLPRLKPWEAPR